MGARPYKIRLFVVMCHLQVYLGSVEGLDMPPRKLYPLEVNYKTGDFLNFEVTFTGLMKSQEDQRFVSALYEYDTKDPWSSPKLVTEILPLTSLTKHVYSIGLDAKHDGIQYFIKIENGSDQYYKEYLITLRHKRDNYNNQKENCLKKCIITFNIWEPKRRVRLVVEPPLKNITYYQIGDRFFHNCTSLMAEKITFSWIKQKGGASVPSNIGSSYSSIDVILDESYNNTDMLCGASYIPKGEDVFDNTFLRTKLIFRPRSAPETIVPWYTITIIVAVITATAVAALVYFCRKRCHTEHEYDYIVEIQNELYVPGESMQYALPYEQRPLPPPPQPLPATKLYVNVS